MRRDHFKVDLSTKQMADVDIRVVTELTSLHTLAIQRDVVLHEGLNFDAVNSNEQGILRTLRLFAVFGAEHQIDLPKNFTNITLRTTQPSPYEGFFLAMADKRRDEIIVLEIAVQPETLMAFYRHLYLRLERDKRVPERYLPLTDDMQMAHLFNDHADVTVKLDYGILTDGIDQAPIH